MMETPPPSLDSFYSGVLSDLSNSSNEHHGHVCTMIGELSEELNDRNIPLIQSAYFNLISTYINHLATNPPDPYPDGHNIDALGTIIWLALEKSDKLEFEFEFDISDKLIQYLHLKSIGQNGIVSALKCLSWILMRRKENVEWCEVEEIYGVVLEYIVDHRPLVREESHICVSEVMQYFHKSRALDLLAPASNVFERFFTRAEWEQKSNVFERFFTRVEWQNNEVVYILDALKLSLPYMSMESITKILKHLKTLWKSKKEEALITRGMKDALMELCMFPGGDVDPEVLVDLLCFICFDLLRKNHDYLSLLDVGLKKVYNLNREICVVKLPSIFTRIIRLFAHERDELSLAVMGVLKSLIDNCIDESLIKEGVINSTKSTPTIIEELCEITAGLTSIRHYYRWEAALQVVSAMFDKLGHYSCHLFTEPLKEIGGYHEYDDIDIIYKIKMDECLGSAVGAMGADYVLKILPLDLDSKKYIEIIEEEYEENNLWLIPILKKYIVGDRLSVFTESILPIIKATEHKSEMLKQQGKNVDEFVYSLWSLLPSFCNYPLDTSKSFKDVEKALRDTLEECNDQKIKETAGVQMIICSSLQILIKQNKNILQGIHDHDDDVKSAAEKRAIAQYNPEIASQNLSVFKSFAPQLLSHLCGGVLLNCSKYTLLKDNIAHVQSTIGDVASISDKDEIEESLKSVIEKLLLLNNKRSEKEYPYPVWEYLADLAVSLLPRVDAEKIDFLFQAVIKPVLKDNQLPIQKKAYKVLSIILQQFKEINVRNLKELHQLMIESKPSCQISAKCARLDCLYFIILHVSNLKYNSEERMHHMITCFVNEIMVALKEGNMKIRDRAYNLLVKIGHACANEQEKGGMLQFLSMVVGNIPGINSSAESDCSYDFTQLVSETYNFGDPSTFLLLEEKKREIIEANLGLLKVFVGDLEAETLQTHLKSMVESLINVVLEMLMKKCGMDAVISVMKSPPEEDHINIGKLQEETKNFEELAKADTSSSSRVLLFTKTLDQLDDELKTRSAKRKHHSDDDDLDFNSQGQIRKTTIITSQPKSTRAQKRMKNTTLTYKKTKPDLKMFRQRKGIMRFNNLQSSRCSSTRSRNKNKGR